MMITFQDRINWAFKRENKRRADAGEPRLTKKDLWEAANKTSASASHWFGGANGADLDTCMLIAPKLKVAARWLFDGSGAPDEDKTGSAYQSAKEPEPPAPEASTAEKLEHIKQALAHMLKAAELEDRLELREPGAADGYPEEVVKQAMRELWQESADHLKVHSADYIADALAKKLLTWINKQARSKRRT